MGVTKKKDYSCWSSDSYIPRKIRREVNKRDGGKCVFCGSLTNYLCHSTPKCRGGKTTVDNLLTCCKKCSREKRIRFPLEWFMDGYFKEDISTFELDLKEEFVRIKVILKDEIIYGESDCIPRNEDRGFWMTTDEGMQKFIPINDNLITIEKVEKDGKNQRDN